MNDFVYMLLNTLIGLACVAGFIIAFLGGAYISFCRSSDKGPDELTTASIFALVVGIALMSPPFLTEGMDKNTCFINKAGVVVRYFDSPDFIRQSEADRLERECLRFDFARQDIDASVKFIAHPITENPKVRNLQIWVRASVRRSPDLYAEYYAKTGEISGSALQKFIQYQLYEMNEANSKKFATFYNPLDETQQKEFAAIVRGFLYERLNKNGFQTAEIDSVRFSLD